MIELLILNLKRGEMLIHQKRDKLVVCVIKKHAGECLVCKGVHMVKDFPNVRCQ